MQKKKGHFFSIGILFGERMKGVLLQVKKLLLLLLLLSFFFKCKNEVVLFKNEGPKTNSNRTENPRHSDIN